MLLSGFFTLQYGVKSYRSLVVLHHAQQLGIDYAADIRGWMTLGYLEKNLGIPISDLLTQLELSEETPLQTTIGEMARQADTEVHRMVQHVQQIIVQNRPATAPPVNLKPAASLLGDLFSSIESALLRYGLPVLAASMVLGALSLPVPSGALVSISAFMLQQANEVIFPTLVVIVGFSVLGDIVGYFMGKTISENSYQRWLMRVGYDRDRLNRIDTLFQRWAAVTLVVTKSALAPLSLIVSMLAGSSRYSLGRYIAFSILGRVLWGSGYFLIGFYVSRYLELASGFLGYVSIFLAAGTIFALSARQFFRVRLQQVL